MPWSLSRMWANTVVSVQLLTVWLKKLWAWWTAKSRKTLLFEAIASATSYEAWADFAFQLDECLDKDMWRQGFIDKAYDYRVIHERLTRIYEYQAAKDVLGLINLIRSGLVRNLGNITAPNLYNQAHAGTKLLIEDYITQVALAIEYITDLPPNATTWTAQTKLDVLHNSRAAYGRSVLVLQGGAVFGLCHLGVVKALHLRGLLPRIIAGTATGAIIAALVGVRTEDELLDSLVGENIDITAFTNLPYRDSGRLQTLYRRLKRWRNEGHFLDLEVLKQVLRSNVGEYTFEEAYERTKRVLNITVTTDGGPSIPNLLNYLTAPNVLIWSAALASNTPSSYESVTILAKNEKGEVVPWPLAAGRTLRPTSYGSYRHRKSPLSRIGELFNVNHFVVSQARPYLAPFLRSDLYRPNPRQDRRWKLSMFVAHFVVGEIRHRLRQLDKLGLLPDDARRFLLDEDIPGPSLTLVPEITPGDFFKLLENPTTEAIDYWILRGERSVWPVITALKIRLAIEVELDKGYQLVRARKPLKPIKGSSSSTGQKKNEGKSETRSTAYNDADNNSAKMSKRVRAASFGAGGIS